MCKKKKRKEGKVDGRKWEEGSEKLESDMIVTNGYSGTGEMNYRRENPKSRHLIQRESNRFVDTVKDFHMEWNSSKFLQNLARFFSINFEGVINGYENVRVNWKLEKNEITKATKDTTLSI